jgi:hypothetical protein
VLVDISFTTEPADTPVWEDVTEYVREVSTRRGRQGRLGRYEAGTATVVLDNRERLFDPLRGSGPYVANLVPMRRIRIRAVWEATTYPLFSGFIEDWHQSWRPGADATTAVRAVDGFKVLSLARITASYTTEDTDARINNVLNDVGWPAGDRDLDEAGEDLQASVLTDASALDHIHLAEQTEIGHFWIGPDGVAVFRRRSVDTDPPYDTSQATFDDPPSGGEYPYMELDAPFDDTAIWNVVRITRDGGTLQEDSDSASIDKYYPRVLSYSGLLYQTDGAALTAAGVLLARHKDANWGIMTMTLYPQRADIDMWAQALGRDLLDLITIRRDPPGPGDSNQAERRISFITHDFRPEFWRTKFGLIPDW